MSTSSKPIIVIAGPTASGKSSLAAKLANRYAGEIICSDSRTVYKGMDIGTAKPTKSERQQVQHYGLDLVEPNQQFSAGQFKRYADEVIADIHSRDLPVFLVGGSGLYIDSVVYDFSLASKPEKEQREKYNAMTLNELQQEAATLGLNLGSDTMKNPRHLRRALERQGQEPKKKKLPACTYYFAININREELFKRIEERAKNMIDMGFVMEVDRLMKKYGRAVPALQAPGYKAFIEYLDGELSQGEAIQKFIQNDKKLAKRQLTWLRKNPDITWVNSSDEAEQQIELIFRKI